VDHPIPDVPVTITILVVSVAVVFTVWVPVIMYRSAIRHGRSTNESLRLGCALVAVFAVWFGLSAGYTQVEAFHDGPGRPPWLVYLFFALIVIGPTAVARSSSLDELLADRRTLAKLLITQTARWLGCVFLVLEVGGQLPSFFAYPAAFGDIAVGVTACVAVIALIWSTSRRPLFPLHGRCLACLISSARWEPGSWHPKLSPWCIPTHRPRCSPNGRWSSFRHTWCPSRSSCTSPRFACCWQTGGAHGMNIRPSPRR
jgi:hypothetical protein